MTDYTIESDPYLSEKANSDLTKLKADGVDVLSVERFLLNTAPLMAPRRSTVPTVMVATIISALGFASFLSWAVSGDPIWCERYLVGVLAFLFACGIIALIEGSRHNLALARSILRFRD